MARTLGEALAEGNGEKAVRWYFDLVDQAYGKPVQSLEVKAGPDQGHRVQEQRGA